jgi:hypothetical protein
MYCDSKVANIPVHTYHKSKNTKRTIVSALMHVFLTNKIKEIEWSKNDSPQIKNELAVL